jgi:acyl carrier protein
MPTTIIDLLSKALKRNVAEDDDFFADLDGNSLLAVEMGEMISREYGVPLEVDFIFDNPTPKEMEKELTSLLAGT